MVTLVCLKPHHATTTSVFFMTRNRFIVALNITSSGNQFQKTQKLFRKVVLINLSSTTTPGTKIYINQNSA